MTQSSPNQNEEPGFRQQFQVQGTQLVERVKELIHEGNVRDIIITHEGRAIVHFPVTVGVVGALLTHCTIEVVRTDQS